MSFDWMANQLYFLNVPNQAIYATIFQLRYACMIFLKLGTVNISQK